MENKTIHNGLDNSEIRDYLSKQLRNRILNNNYNTNVNDVKDKIKRLELELKEMKKALARVGEITAIEKLIENQGWQIFDISDNVRYEKYKYFEFLGTESEFDNLIISTKIED